MSTLVKSARRIRETIIVLICTAIAAILIWRGLTYDRDIPDLTTYSLCVALAFSLVFTGIAAIDCRNSPSTSDNGL